MNRKPIFRKLKNGKRWDPFYTAKNYKTALNYSVKKSFMCKHKKRSKRFARLIKIHKKIYEGEKPFAKNLSHDDTFGRFMNAYTC